MQSVSSAFTTATSANNADLIYGAQVSWLKTLNSAYQFFKIGTSTIGGPDLIPGTGAAPTFLDKYQYTDYSDYIDAFSITKSLGQYPYGTFSCNATLVLDNTTLLFTPGYDATIGPYIQTGRPVKLSLGFGTESIYEFAGYCTKPVNDLDSRSVTLNCYDGMDYLNGYTSTTTATQVNQSADQIIIALLQEVGFTSSEYVVDQSLQQPIGYLAPYGQLVGDIIQALCEAEQGIAFFDENGVFNFWNRQHIANLTTPVWTFNYDNIVNWTDENTPVINDVIVQANPRVVQANQLIWQLTSPVLVPAGGTYTVEADFSDDNGPLPVTAVDLPTYSASGTTDSYYQTNMASDGSGAAQNGNISISSHTLNGTSYLVTFSNSYSLPIYITALVLYGTPAKVTYVINQEYKNAASITANELNPGNNGQPLTISNDYIQTPSTALSNAYQLVTDYSTPNVRITCEVFEVPQLQFGDCVSVKFDDANITKNYTVVGISYNLDGTQLISQNLELEVKLLVKYFQINVSQIGGTDQIAPG